MSCTKGVGSYTKKGLKKTKIKVSKQRELETGLWARGSLLKGTAVLPEETQFRLALSQSSVHSTVSSKSRT